MILIDTNVWLYACLSDTTHHALSRAWLEDVLSGGEPITLPWPWCTTAASVRPTPISAASLVCG